jgi:hypothetical protein
MSNSSTGSAINKQTMISRNSNILATVIGSETVMMSIDQGRYYGMNKTGSYIWKTLEHPMSFEDLCAKLLQDFNITEVQCTEDVIPFLEEMSKEKIIEIG